MFFRKYTTENGSFNGERAGGNQKKGYFVNCVSRIGADRKWHDALQIERADAPRLVEQLFRQRLVAEFQAEGRYHAAIIFSHDYAAETIITAVERFQKNNGGKL